MRRNFLTMLGGGAVAQAITLVTLPILGRLYTPESFGYLAGAMSIASICAALLHGRYHMAIPIALGTQDPPGLLWLSVLLTFCLSLPAVLLVASLTSEGWAEVSSLAFLAACLALTIGTALLDISSYWLSYRGRFGMIARNQSMRTLLTSAGQIVIAPITSFGMVLGTLLGIWVSICWILFRQAKDEKSAMVWPGRHRLGVLAYAYRHFPLYGTPQGLLAATSWNLLPLALLRFEGPGFAGLYWAAFRVLIAPLTLFNSSYRQVTLRAISLMPQLEARRLLLRHTAALGLVGIALALLIFCAADRFFPIVMGPGWDGASQIAAALSLGTAADLFKVPAICFEQSRHRQKRLLIWEGGIFILRYGMTLVLINAGETLMGVQAFALGGFVGWSAFCVRVLFFSSPDKE